MDFKYLESDQADSNTNKKFNNIKNQIISW